MIGPCPYLCDKKTEQGYCLYTACMNPKYSNASLPVRERTYPTRTIIKDDDQKGPRTMAEWKAEIERVKMNGRDSQY